MSDSSPRHEPQRDDHDLDVEVEKAEETQEARRLLEPEQEPAPAAPKHGELILWTTVNLLATIGIVSGLPFQCQS